MMIKRRTATIWLMVWCLALAGGFGLRAQPPDGVTLPGVEEPAPPIPETPVPEVGVPEPAGPDEAEPDPAPVDLEPEPDSVFVVSPDALVPPELVSDDEIEGLISVNLEEVVLQDVVRMFARISDANIIASGTNLQQKVTVSLHNVDWKTGLESILDMHDLMLRERTPGSEVYSVVPKPPEGVEPLVIEPIFLKYANVNDAQAIVNTLIEARGSVSPYASGNALVVRTTADNLVEIKKVIDSIDKPRQQVYIEAKFLELNDDAIRKLGINWQVLEEYRVGVGSLDWSFGEERVWDRGREDTSRRFDDRSQSDVLSSTYDREGMLDTASRTTLDSIDRGREIRSDQWDDFRHTIEDVRSAVLSAGDVNIILSALKGMDGVSIVSNPKIMVANEETATIHIGEKERPFIASVVTQADAPAIVTYNPGEEVDFGVKLSVTPTINTDTNITLRIVPELTRFVRQATAPDGQSYPVVATKTIETVFSLENGKTAAIGGLTETTESDSTRKVPLLGDIPLIGKYLFSHQTRKKSQQETIIFVTVGLANPHTMTRNEGLPEDARLIHRHMTREDVRRREAELLDINRPDREDDGRSSRRFWQR